EISSPISGRHPHERISENTDEPDPKWRDIFEGQFTSGQSTRADNSVLVYFHLRVRRDSAQ
ncbi:MAG TPA: hypothetical protein VEC99_04345, partial [Clostridia bacterium]|nr:hypothetical protein [Clostridia bacterium]